MKSTATESYLVAEVMTATPQKLQLMLLEAAIRSAELRGGIGGRATRSGRACASSAQEIVGEMVSSLDYEADTDFVRNVAEVYLFIFRSLSEANSRRDEQRLDDALRVLHVERETWRQVCDTYPGKISGEPPPRAAAPHFAAPTTKFTPAVDSSAESLSLEA